jgi:hypothetical protein
MFVLKHSNRVWQEKGKACEIIGAWQLTFLADVNEISQCETEKRGKEGKVRHDRLCLSIESEVVSFSLFLSLTYILSLSHLPTCLGLDFWPMIATPFLSLVSSTRISHQWNSLESRTVYRASFLPFFPSMWINKKV